MGLEEVISLNQKLALSRDALWAWIEEQSTRDRVELAEERKVPLEDAQLDERARETELMLACERRAEEGEARREEAEREAGAREAELALALEVAAPEERNSLFRIRLLQAQNIARDRASVHVDNASFIDHSASGRRNEFYEEASMPMVVQ
ncbi:hypothetical protein HPB50_007437 [Hyalomma asiaticum]|uniref:Uncharacterized protein n=1 Tax=Hyalomma asiaticum TaxID=266040 RepID=A0ACB7RUQ4_HYAAI|nr:hypothetical protein HPB50_007437 [Hyalomma asiaticum]